MNIQSVQVTSPEILELLNAASQRPESDNIIYEIGIKQITIYGTSYVGSKAEEYRNIRCLLYESTQRTDHSHQRYSNTVSLYSTSIFTHSHICTINDP